ncbi:MAG TPA: regulatory iron-sulfur-containing complex subunit RicT [Gemmatimonadaceae bacterium]
MGRVMAHLIEVAFTGNRKEFFLWESDDPPAPRAGVIVEADRGEDFGRVHATGELAEKRSLGCAHGCGSSAPARKALRLATATEVQQAEGLAKLNEEARRHASQRVRAQGLVMKVSDAEWQWDRRKLTLYFTAEHRVDFRQLVRELAAQFRTRIELKQIGVRDEAKRLDGIGRCGRQYCSASWLPELRPVNLGVAKEQRLSLNPTQISGACGRLMCCLRYEHDVYVAARKRFPKEGRIFDTARGEEKLVAVDIFNERLTLRSVEGETRVISLATFREETGQQAVAAVETLSAVEVEADEAADNGVVVEAPEEDADLTVASADAVEPGPEAGTDHAGQKTNRRRRGRRGGRGGRRARDRGLPEQDRRAGGDGTPPAQPD